MKMPCCCENPVKEYSKVTCTCCWTCGTCGSFGGCDNMIGVIAETCAVISEENTNDLGDYDVGADIANIIRQTLKKGDK